MAEKKIWKFPLEVVDTQRIKMPVGAKILTVKAQRAQPGLLGLGEIPYLWAMVDPTAEMTERKVRIIGTGHPIGCDPGEYIDSFFLADGALVFHVFIEPEGSL